MPLRVDIQFIVIEVLRFARGLNVSFFDIGLVKVFGLSLTLREDRGAQIQYYGTSVQCPMRGTFGGPYWTEAKRGF